jgi:hypothetical protein
MIGIGAIGILAFLIFLISRYGMKLRAAAAKSAAGNSSLTSAVTGYTPQWYEFLLAAVVVALAVILLFWQFPPGTLPGEETLAWSSDTRAVVFLSIMLAVVGIGLVVFVITVFAKFSREQKVKSEFAAAPAADPVSANDNSVAAATASHESPSAIRLLGLLLFGAAYLILNWSYVPGADQYAMMVHLIYPAGLVVALVMLFDKASRAWNVKQPGETVREWILCDVILFLFILSYLNILQSDAGEKYAGMFWDFINVAGFLLIFWLIDRKVTRLRFLAGYLYLIALPILLLIWRTVHEVVDEGDAPVLPETSWWESIWPFFGLAVVFFVLEIILLIASREAKNQTAGIVKDIIFVLLYVIILIAAIPGAPE